MGMGIDDSLNGLICVHLWSISLRLFKDLLSAIAIMQLQSLGQILTALAIWGRLERPGLQFSINTVLSCQFIQIKRKGERKGRER